MLATDPAPIHETVAMLASCLALVRPVGMAQADADEWLRVAARELSYLPGDLLADGAAHARRTCTHHGQIVPAIIKETDERLAARRKATRPVEAHVRPVALLEVEKPSSEDFAELLRSLDGLKVGSRR